MLQRERITVFDLIQSCKLEDAVIKNPKGYATFIKRGESTIALLGKSGRLHQCIAFLGDSSTTEN